MPVSRDRVLRSISMECSAEEAFDAWTTRIHLWWPTQRISASRQASSRVIMEGRVGGRLYERTGDGTEHAWGRITLWEPPKRIVYDWFLEADPGKATEVDVRFIEEDGTTTVRVDHAKWEHAAEDVAELQRACVAAPEGWTGILEDYAREVSGSMKP